MTNPYKLWKQTHLNILSNAEVFFNQDKPVAGGFDTETTGLHIIKDKPFLIQFGWLVHTIPASVPGRVFTFYPTPENMKEFFKLAARLKFLVAHNIKYDLHMLSNIGYAAEVQAMTNLVESMAVARLALEAIPEREGGDSLKLKKLGEKYVHSEAGRSEHIIKEELNRLNAERIKVLSQALKQFPIEGEVTEAGRQKFWGKGAIEKFLKDPTNDVEDLPEGVRDVWIDWQDEYPEPTYEDVNRAVMIKYGGEDIITMMELFKRTYAFAKKREQLEILKMESDLILPMYRMERVGLKADMNYLEESRLRVKAYITKLRNELYEIAGEKVTVGQHARLKQIFLEKWGITLEACDNPNLKKLTEGEAGRFATLISALRSLEKWYSTYIKRIIKNASYDGNVYTQINSAGAVSGRMSSDIQQFPKKALKTLEGEELFHPRKAFIVKGEEYDEIIYIDYDQIELVTQAHYTLLVSGGDLNLCRAYMPFQCKHYQTGETYDFKHAESRSRWSDTQPNGDSAWLDEKGVPWTKTDVHGQTTHKAFPHIPLGTDEFKEWRGKGKMFNFMANYGGGKLTAMKALDLEEEYADALVRGYAEAFPHVKIYQNKITVAHKQKGYVVNGFGRRYYLEDTNISYKLANYVVQGTCADALKRAIINLDTYILENKLKSRIVIPVHDELQFDKYKGEEWAIPEFLRIMQEAFDWCLVPVTAGIERTTTNWAEKN